jgi:hypothetical protein
MNKNKIIIGMITTALLLTGCGGNSINVLPDESKNIAISSEVTDTDDTVSNINLDHLEYETIGDVIEIREGEVHVLTGDIAEIFKVSNDDLLNFYLGQTVYVTKETETDFSLLPFINDDFSRRYTNMGQMIERVSGSIISIDEGTAVLDTAEGAKTVGISEDTLLQENVEYEFDIIVFSEDDMYLMEAYDVNAKLVLTINELTRTENGELELLTSDNNGMQYIIATYYPTKNFNLTDLAVGQTIEVYSTIMTLSIPAQVKATRIDLISAAATGTTSLEYDVVGEVVYVKDNEVHILQGDMIEIFNVDSDLLKSVFLGQTVKLFDNAGVINIEPFIIEDFSIQHNSMGMMITESIGLVINVETTEDSSLITVMSEDTEVTYKFYGDNPPMLQTTYEFYTMSFTPDETSIVDYYNPESIIEITVTSINRAENGELMFSGTDKDAGEYNIGTSSPMKNFNLSELKEGDVLEVYADAIMESWPMQVSTRKINMK